MATAILDTNFLLIPEQFRVDIFTEISRLLPGVTFAIMQGSLLELRKIAHSKDLSMKDRQSAKIGLSLIEQKKITEISHKGHVDDAIVKLIKPGIYVATADKELKRRIIVKKGTLIILKQNRHLTLETNI